MKHFMLLIFFSLALYASERVTLQLQWLHQFQFAGFYAAKENGFYEDTDLEVDIKEFNASINVVKDVLSGDGRYGIGRSSLVLDYNNFAEIVALGAIFQSSPSVLISTNPKIKTINDLADKKIMVTNDEVSSASIFAMLRSNNINSNAITVQQHSFNLQDLIEGKTDAMASYISNEPFALERLKIPYTVFDPKDYGLDFYGDILFTSKEETLKHPKRVKNFYAATLKGWLWAFEHIEECAKIIYEKYNTQNKSLESLIYEGHTLKKLALADCQNFGFISKKKFHEIAKIYQLSGVYIPKKDLSEFVDPLKLNKKSVKIGVLANISKEESLKKYTALQKTLNDTLEEYDFKITPLTFLELEASVKNAEIDFIITNPMLYVQIEHKYYISRIATLRAETPEGKSLSRFGGVIFTNAKNLNINSIKDLANHTLGAVNENSLGGYVMAKELFYDQKIDNIDIKFFNSHDRVISGVLSGEVDAGSIRTETLEQFAKEQNIDLSSFRLLEPKKYPDFPYLISTKLYPEWPFAKLKHTPEKLSNSVLSVLISMRESDAVLQWSTPHDYGEVHQVLKKLKIAPYDKIEFDIFDVFERYIVWFYIFSLIAIIGVASIIYVKKRNRDLENFNNRLKYAVLERTRELEDANEKLKIMSSYDSLTNVINHGYFMEFGSTYFDIAKRNDSQLQVLSLDLDYFKQVNDTYGHQAGDKVLITFTETIKNILRKSDIFGRIGGEEFAICLQNTSQEGALLFSQRILNDISNLKITYGEHLICITVSIGIAELKNDLSFEELLYRSDKALYKAKHSGRNRVEIE